MTRRKPVELPPDQQCECPSHDATLPPTALARVFYPRGDKMCYEWWCETCCEEGEIDEMDEPWPRDEAGRFAKSFHCPVTPYD